MKRRTLLGAAALITTGVAEAAEKPDPVWNQGWQTPEGGEFRLADFGGQALLLNFWATWCPPCVEELPLLDAFQARQRERGWQVVTLAIDQPSAVRAFLRKRALALPVGLAGLEGTELTRRLGNSNGGLPFSVLFDRQGRIVERKLGRLQSADLQRWLARA